MAFKKQWIPLRNLAIRRAIPAEEVDVQHNGKTAIQWAMFHGETGLAKELLYLLYVRLLQPTQTFLLSSESSDHQPLSVSIDNRGLESFVLLSRTNRGRIKT
jgi:ankyrin repeat protein